MKKLLFGATLLMLISSCGGGQKQKDSFAWDTSVTDSSLVMEDSLALNSLEDSFVVPANADESFIDFLYNFSQSRRLQRTRIDFPIAYNVEGEVTLIDEKEWVHDSFFSDIEAYTVLFDHPEEMELVKDESANQVKVEWIYLEQKQVKSYSFERKNGIWILKNIELLPFTKGELAPESFYSFYYQFATDSVFQKRSLATPLVFTTTSSDDEFEVIDTFMDYEQWLTYCSVLPPFLTNVNYGQSLKSDARTKIVELKGFGNGFNNTLYFEKKGKTWKLVKYEDLGD
ncbi:MAG: DUF4348 domain-containing protein [Phocaeicola sp.]